jgi:hypothetical protein
MMRRITIIAWLGAAVIVALLARTIAYAVDPTPAARLLEARAGGPALPVLAIVSLTLGVSVAVAICSLVALGVRERALLERRPSAIPTFRARRALALAVALSIVTSVGGGLLEAFIHWRAGLGWHGVQCVFGPVHRDLLPIETALSFVAAALLAAAQHVIAWMRRTFALLRLLPPRQAPDSLSSGLVALAAPRTILCLSAGVPRAPPARS